MVGQLNVQAIVARSFKPIFERISDHHGDASLL
jgi:hypothetical protein